MCRKERERRGCAAQIVVVVFVVGVLLHSTVPTAPNKKRRSAKIFLSLDESITKRFD